MIKFTADLQRGGRLYAFGLSQENLIRLAQSKPIFTSMDYAGLPDHHILILVVPHRQEPDDITPEDMEALAGGIIRDRPDLDLDKLHVFPMCQRVYQELQGLDYGYAMDHVFTDPLDMVMIQSGESEQAMHEYYQRMGLITQATRVTTKGFKPEGKA